MPARAGLSVVSDDVRRFVLTSIPSVPHLEALVLFQRSPDVRRDATALARALYLPAARTAVVLADLHAIGLLVPDGDAGGYRYRPHTEELAVLVDRLAVAYAADVVGIARLIHDAAARNAQRFADAFRWRKGK